MMELRAAFRVHCCDKTQEFAWKHEAIEFLMRHIRRNHRKLLPKLEREGKQMALDSQLGRGYGGDWKGATATFREAWRENALEQLLERQPRSER